MDNTIKNTLTSIKIGSENRFAGAQKIAVLALCVVLAGRCYSLSAQEVRWDYPIKPGMEEWKNIRLYDRQGNLLRQQKTNGGTVQFNVSDLPYGVYYLHVYDGVNENPEMRLVIVEQ